jgi:two-component system, LytTR family, response regulator LytT
MRVLIIEDEKLAADNLEKLILSLDENIKVVAKIGLVRESVKWLLENSADLIFLDIQLSDGLSFDIFNSVKVSTPIIFTTAYDQYAIKAFKLNSVDYLLKPINKKDLSESLQKYHDRFKSSHQPEINFTDLINSIKHKQEYKARFAVYAGQKIKSIPVTNIAYFFITEKCVFLTTLDNVQYALTFTIDKLEEIVDPKQFFRLNRKILANIDSIKSIYSLSKTRITIELSPKFPEEVVVSLSRAADFRSWLDK